MSNSTSNSQIQNVKKLNMGMNTIKIKKTDTKMRQPDIYNLIGAINIYNIRVTSDQTLDILILSFQYIYIVR